MIEELAELLAESVKRMRALRERSGYQAHPESTLVKRATTPGGQLGTYAATALIGYEIAAAQIAAAEDHIYAIAHLLLNRRGQIAPFVLARAAIEASSRAAYIIDPGVPEKDRASAVLGERIHELQQTARLIRGHDPKTTNSPEAQADLAQTEKAIHSLKQFAKEQSLTEPGRRSFTFVVTWALSTGTRNRSLATTAIAAYSALAHASPEMLLTHTVDRSNPHWAPFEIGLAEPNTEFLFDSILAIMLAYTSAVNHQVRGYGWPSDDWASWLTHVRDTFGRYLGNTEDEFKRHVEESQHLWRIGEQEFHSVPLPRFIQEMLKEQKQMFTAKFGRPPGSTDPLFFDPEAETPQPAWISEERYIAELVELVAALGQLSPPREYAIKRCGFVASTHSWPHLTEEKQQAWKAALLEYYSLHREVPGEDFDLVVLPETD